jgi:glycosyltransferase involved in cell wall biosynthesis
MQLSVIVPVYNVEQYIRPCVESIFKQDLNEDDFEVILVNDGTKDNSFKRIKDLVTLHPNIKVVEQSNQGLSAARNAGLKYAGGEYVLFVDSDDLLIDKTLKPVLDCAVSSSVDMIMGSFIKMSGEQIDTFVLPPSSDMEMFHMSGKEAFIYFYNPKESYVWRTLYRRDFLLDNHIRFIPGVFFEDILFTTECYIKADKCISSPIPFYIYRQHPNSIVSTINRKKLLDFNIVIEKLWLFRITANLTEVEQKKLSDVIFSTFSIEMWYLLHGKDLYGFRKDIVEDLKMRVPNLGFYNGFKQFLISVLFRWIPYTYLRVRFCACNLMP